MRVKVLSFQFCSLFYKYIYFCSSFSSQHFFSYIFNLQYIMFAIDTNGQLASQALCSPSASTFLSSPTSPVFTFHRTFHYYVRVSFTTTASISSVRIHRGLTGFFSRNLFNSGPGKPYSSTQHKRCQPCIIDF